MEKGGVVMRPQECSAIETRLVAKGEGRIRSLGSADANYYTEDG